MGKLFSFSFLFQALIVVIAVLAFSYFDPFDILVSNKLTLRDTPAQVQQIKSIGELISAEYYGEVISHCRQVKDCFIVLKGTLKPLLRVFGTLFHT